MNSSETVLVENAQRNLNNDSCETKGGGGGGGAERAVNIVGYTVIILVSPIANSLLIYAVRRDSRLNTITHRLMVNMAAADILVTVCNVPGRLARQITGRWNTRSMEYQELSSASLQILSLTPQLRVPY